MRDRIQSNRVCCCSSVSYNKCNTLMNNLERKIASHKRLLGKSYYQSKRPYVTIFGVEKMIDIRDMDKYDGFTITWK